jgi:hypothetical protein
VTAARRPESQEQILEAAVAALTEADIPPADQDGWLDPDAPCHSAWHGAGLALGDCRAMTWLPFAG